MLEENIEFYNEVSAEYSKRRYPHQALNYSQYLFKKRLASFLVFLAEIEKDLPIEVGILEIGCADGVVFRAIEDKFPRRFTKLVGIDISPKMIAEAKRQSNNSRARFYLRDEFLEEEFDIVIELGVHPFNLSKELTYVSDRLKSRGYFFYDAAGVDSLYARMKLRDKAYAQDYKTYESYESIFKKVFLIKKSKVYGLFIPKLWGFPFLGRLLQSLLEFMFSPILPNLFHEKLYVLKKGEPDVR